MTDVLAAHVAEIIEHGERKLRRETDCWDVHTAMGRDDPGFVLLDVRPPERFRQGHIPEASNLPHARIVERNLEAIGPAALSVAYCAGPHCNGADRAALRLARLGHPVKVMIGGITGWLDEGFELTTG